MASTLKHPHKAAVRIGNAERRASELLAQLDIKSAPVPVENIAQRIGIQVERASFGDNISAVLVVQDDKGFIGVSSSQSHTRQRFSIAHEIGHFMLHKNKMPVFIDKQFIKPYLAAFRDEKSSAGNDMLEREANSFAASLLMPEDFVRKAIAQIGLNEPDDNAIERIAQYFQVSSQAMLFRLANLSVLPRRRRTA